LKHRVLALLNLCTHNDEQLSLLFTSVNFQKSLADSDETLRVETLQLLANVSKYGVYQKLQGVVYLLEEGLQMCLTEQAKLAVSILSS